MEITFLFSKQRLVVNCEDLEINLSSLQDQIETSFNVPIVHQKLVYKGKTIHPTTSLAALNEITISKIKIMVLYSKIHHDEKKSMNKEHMKKEMEKELHDLQNKESLQDIVHLKKKVNVKTEKPKEYYVTVSYKGDKQHYIVDENITTFKKLKEKIALFYGFQTESEMKLIAKGKEITNENNVISGKTGMQYMILGTLKLHARQVLQDQLGSDLPIRLNNWTKQITRWEKQRSKNLWKPEESLPEIYQMENLLNCTLSDLTDQFKNGDEMESVVQDLVLKTRTLLTRLQTVKKT